MKRYIKPNTEMHSIELTQMIAESNTFTAAPTKINVGSAGSATSDAAGGGALGKETEISSTSIWDEEE